MAPGDIVKDLEAEKRRIARLQQVREQEQQNAKARARAFREQVDAQRFKLQEEMLQKSEKQRQLELQRLHMLVAARSEGIGQAMQAAAEWSSHRQQEAVASASAAAADQRLQRQRFLVALHKAKAAQEAQEQRKEAMRVRRAAILEAARLKAQEQAASQEQRARERREEDLRLAQAERERARRNLPSKIDFRHTRLHELGVPQLVVNHKEGDGPAHPDPAHAAQAATAQLKEIQQQRVIKALEAYAKAQQRGQVASVKLQAEQITKQVKATLDKMAAERIDKQKQDIQAGATHAAPWAR